MTDPPIPYDLVVFDLAGTTVHDGDAVNVCLREAVAAVAGRDVSRAAVNAVMGVRKPDAIRTLLTDAGGGEPPDAVVAAVHDRFVGRMLDHYRSDPTVREVDGAADLFRYLGSRNVRVGLDTGFDRPTAAAILARLGWGPGRVGRRDRHGR